MKKFGLIVSAALWALLCISCNKEIVTVDPDIENPGQPAIEKVHVSFTAGIGTKVSLSEGESSVDIVWSTDDHIAVWDGTEWCDFSATSVNGSSAVFEGDITPDDAFATSDFIAVYPFSAVTDLNSSSISVTIPSAQTVPSGGVVDPKALVSVATCSGEGVLSFEQVCALVKINLTHSGMSAITLEGTGLAGTVVCAEDGSVSSSTALENSISLTSEDGVFDFSTDAADYYVAVLPGTSAPLKVGMVCESDGYTGVRSASSVTFAQGKAQIFIKDSAIDGEYNIYTPEQLLNCASRWSLSFTSTVNICSDIDMSSISSSWPQKDFAGVLNGNNKNIFNYTCLSTSDDNQDAVFMKTIAGTVKNLCFGSTDGLTYDNSSSITLHNTGSSTGWFYAGLFSRFTNGAKVSGIKNFIPIEVKEGNKVKTRVGGIVGVYASGATDVLFEDCVNFGSVSNKSTEAVSASNLGGIVGRFDVAATVSNVVNKGDIVCYNPYVINLGGFSSGLYGGSKLTGCNNYGSITYEVGTLLEVPYIGGLIGNNGTDYTNQSILTDCENFGSLTIVDNGGKNLYCGGVTGLIRNVKLTRCKNHGSIHSKHMQVSRIGGITGTAHINSIIESCENDGPITVTQNKETNAWHGIGGIVGDSENTKPIIKDCVNTENGVITATFYSKTTHNFKCSAAGIVAALGTADNLTGNVNYASISANNIGPDSPYCYVGGIVGIMYSGSTIGTISNNTNYGEVWNQSSNTSYSAAGGLFGSVSITSAIEGVNFGPVKGINAGAVAGVNSAAVSATLCDAVTVNGVTKASVSDEGAWLCPSNTGTITPTYVAHSSSE